MVCSVPRRTVCYMLAVDDKHADRLTVFVGDLHVFVVIDDLLESLEFCHRRSLCGCTFLYLKI